MSIGFIEALVKTLALSSEYAVDMLKKEPGSIFINYALNIRAEMKLIIYYPHLVVKKGVVKKSVKDIKGF